MALLFRLYLGPPLFHSLYRSFSSETDGNRLNYLNDWFVLAQSEDKLLSHRFFFFRHFEYLGLMAKFAKSTLSPSQRISILGAVFESAIKHLVAFLKIVSCPVKTFQKTLGLMVSMSPVLKLGLLHM